jgi:hypothetical protein
VNFELSDDHRAIQENVRAITDRFAPITEQMVLSFLAEKVLGLPKSY